MNFVFLMVRDLSKEDTAEALASAVLPWNVEPSITISRSVESEPQYTAPDP